MIKEAYPLQWPAGWPRTKNPARSRFGKWNAKPTIASACGMLENELRQLIGYNKTYIISTNLKYKTNGDPYSNQREPIDQGVAVYFEFNDNETVIACDTFDKIGCNIHAIVKTIGALRGIDRWGCSELMNRAFTGFQAFPQRATQPTWFSILGIAEDSNEEEIKLRYRTLVKTLHPDVPITGNAEKFIQVQHAYTEAMKKITS
jgi:hypothetical protein